MEIALPGESGRFMSTRIVLISQPGPELSAIHQLLRNPVQYSIREILSMDHINQGLSDAVFDILLMRIPVFVDRHVGMLGRIRVRFPNAGLITSAGRIESSARFLAKSIRRHKLIQESDELNDLPGIIENLKRGSHSSLRMHPRRPQAGEAEVLDSASGQLMRAQFLDFAQMGARLSVRSRVRIHKNSRIQVRYRSSLDPNRVHRIESLVVWEEMAGTLVSSIANGPQQILGVRFIAAV